MTLAPWAASAVPPPTTNLAFDVLAQRVAYSNQTLLDYFFPQAPRAADVQHSWWPHTRHCGQAQCYCVHVTGPSDPRINPSPAKCEGVAGRRGGSLGPLMKRDMVMSAAYCTPEALKPRCPCVTGSGRQTMEALELSTYEPHAAHR